MAQATIDDVRAFWDNRPCNILASNYPVGSPEYLAATELRKYRVEPHIPGFAEFKKWGGKNVLEIGCGIGVDTINFAKAGANVTAVDLSQKSLAITKKRAGVANVPLTLIQADAEYLEELEPPITDEFYDLAYAFGSIHHSPYPRFILHNLFYALKYGGTLKIMVYNKYSWKALWILLKYGKGQFWKFSELIARYSEAQTGCPITHVYSRSSIKKLVESAGFKVKKIEIDHIFKFDIEHYKKHEYVVDWKFRWMPKWLFRALERTVGWHLLVDAVA